MKSLDQIEARIPISSAPFTINQSGSYYLTTNLNVFSGNGIIVEANDVTIDLNGYTIYGYASPASGTAILLDVGFNDITIRNGHILGTGVTCNSSGCSGYGFASGIDYSLIVPHNVRVTNVSVQGCQIYGIRLNSGFSLQSFSPFATIVDFCNVFTAGAIGISATNVSNSNAYNCGNYAISANTVFNCSGYSFLSGGVGILADSVTNSEGVAAGGGDGIDALTATNCAGKGGGTGVGVNVTYLATNCYGLNSASGDGVRAINAINSYGSGNSGRGLYAVTAQNCSGTSATNYGLQAGTAENCTGVSNSNVGLVAYAVQSSFGGCNGNGTGLFLTDYGTVMNCRALAQGGGTGILTGNGCEVINCIVSSSATGIQVGSDCLIQGNNLDQNSNGVIVSGTGNRLDGNRATCPAPGQAFIINGSNNVIIRNTAQHNGTNQFSIIGAANSYGTVFDVHGGGQMTTNEPLCNLVY